ncbi:MAG: SCO family protein [Acidimicrobiia bacterium]|nr:SCO family protein [Acidimicrobiia bacterium]NNL28643.1 SCO family protein [Acidimicrobiia bacterium]
MKSWSSANLVMGILMLVLMTAGCTSAELGDPLGSEGVFQGVELPEPSPKPSFVLTDTAGDPYDFAAATDGKLTLLYFGYTFCPDICPVHLAQITSVLDRNPPLRENTEVVFVSVDPERDSPEVIREYLNGFSEDYVGLTGSTEELRTAEEALGVPPAIIGDTSDPDYLVGHTAQVFAWAPDGLGYTIYPFGTRQSQWAHDLEILAGMGS